MGELQTFTSPKSQHPQIKWILRLRFPFAWVCFMTLPLNYIKIFFLYIWFFQGAITDLIFRFSVFTFCIFFHLVTCSSIIFFVFFLQPFLVLKHFILQDAKNNCWLGRSRHLWTQHKQFTEFYCAAFLVRPNVNLAKLNFEWKHLQ